MPGPGVTGSRGSPDPGGSGERPAGEDPGQVAAVVGRRAQVIGRGRALVRMLGHRGQRLS